MYREPLNAVYIIVLLLLFGALAKHTHLTERVFTDKRVSFARVTLKGAIRNPGVYTVVKGSTWFHVLRQAGGVSARGYLPDDFDVSAPITHDEYLYVAYAYSWRKRVYEK